MRLDTFYSSKPWAKLIAALKIERQDENGQIICAHCGKPIIRKYDCIGHHKIRLTDENVNDFEISLNPENVDLIHFSCHNEIHQRYDGFKQEVFLVYGSPRAGKTTWVREQAYDDDLILDLDRLWEAICKGYHPNRLKANVFGIRDCIVEQIKTRKGKWRNAYIIGGYPLRTDRDRLCEMLRATPIFIDTPKEECLKRATEEEAEWVENWWETFVE